MGKIYFLLGVVCLVFGGAAWHFSQDEEIHIVALGDSITYGTGAPKGEGYVDKLEKKLEESLGIAVRVDNFAVPKYRTENVLKVVEKEKRALQKANYIFLYIGTNDFRRSANYEFAKLDADVLSEGKNVYSADMRELIRKIRLENERAPLLMLGQYHPYTEFANHEEIRPYIEEWNEELVMLAEEGENEFYLPTMDLFLDESKKDVFSDSLHLNEKGYELLAERVHRWVFQMERGSVAE